VSARAKGTQPNVARRHEQAQCAPASRRLLRLARPERLLRVTPQPVPQRSEDEPRLFEGVLAAVPCSNDGRCRRAPARGADRDRVGGGHRAVEPYDIERAVRTIQRGADQLIAKGARIVALGGDHTIAPPLLRAASAELITLMGLHDDSVVSANLRRSFHPTCTRERPDVVSSCDGGTFGPRHRHHGAVRCVSEAMR
jgi:hypothetical protein